MAGLFSKFTGKSSNNADKAGAFIAALKSQLGINDTQASSIESYMREFFQAKKMNKQSGNKDDMHQLRNELMQKIQSVLTPEQMQKFTANFEQLKNIIKS